MNKLIIVVTLFCFSFLSISMAGITPYILAPGDTLEINVVNKTELNTKQVIVPDGSISVPLAGRITADGLTLTELDATLKREFSKYFQAPQLAVLLTPRPIYVVQHDLAKKTVEVKEAKNIAEARAYMGEGTSTVNYGDVVDVNIGEAPDFWEDNWYKVLSAVGVAAGVWNVLR